MWGTGEAEREGTDATSVPSGLQRAEKSMRLQACPHKRTAEREALLQSSEQHIQPLALQAANQGLFLVVQGFQGPC